VRNLRGLILLALFALAGTAIATDFLYVHNVSTTDTIKAGYMVGANGDSLLVVAKVKVGAATERLTVADSLYNGALPGSAYRAYWKMRIYYGTSADDSANRFVHLRVRDIGGRSYRHTIQFDTALDKETLLPGYFLKIDSVIGVGKAVSDSFRVTAFPARGAQTVVDTSILTRGFIGIAYDQILPRQRGRIVTPGQQCQAYSASAVRSGGRLVYPHSVMGQVTHGIGVNRTKSFILGYTLDPTDAAGLAWIYMYPLIDSLR